MNFRLCPVDLASHVLGRGHSYSVQTSQCLRLAHALATLQIKTPGLRVFDSDHQPEIVELALDTDSL
jgi:hypothetical protein